MIYKNYSETAHLLAKKITENFENNFSLTFISSESKDFAKKVADNLGVKLVDPINPQNLIIVDNGSTLAVEYDEFTDEIRKKHPTTKIIIALPIIPDSEINILSKNCDTLLYLHADPFFFSLEQFYQEHNF